MMLPMAAKPCIKLPNPGRLFRSGDVSVASEGETAVSEPVIAGAR
jgi:hypothetical protein